MSNKEPSEALPSKKEIIDYIIKAKKPKTKINIEKFFEIKKNKKVELKKIIDKMVKSGEILKIKKNYYDSPLPFDKKLIFIVTKIENNKIFSMPVKLKKRKNNIQVIVKSDKNNSSIDTLRIGQKFLGVITFSKGNIYYVDYLNIINNYSDDFFYGLVNYKNKKFYFQIDSYKQKLIEIIPNKIIKIQKDQLVKVTLHKQSKTTKARIIEQF